MASITLPQIWRLPLHLKYSVYHFTSNMASITSPQIWRLSLHLKYSVYHLISNIQERS